MKITKILIANRGEIALRIIRTCKEMGIKTVALCPQKGDEDNFLETKFADEFYYLGRGEILGYLDQKKIIQIAKKAKVDAIHPGYGFLAENGDFADLCQINGIKFIGPSGKVLRRVGNKIEARRIAKIVGCPLLPASDKPLKDEKECFKAAKRIKPPFLLKAANGGGGIGIKIIDRIDKNEISQSFQKLKREVNHAFGSDEIFIEKFLSNPRHIEFQILGDGRGDVVHFGERECSVQRRHQKIIEEAPSPFLNKSLRKKMGKLAVKIGEYLKYEGLGTVEFLIDAKSKNFYFIEINPRLQVEHPVTELTCNVDLVAEQIKVAQDQKLDFSQRKIKFRGWAMEFRINAEDSLNDFLPASGIVNYYLPPSGRGVEVHSFLHQGQVIFPHFDSLLAKLVVFGETRDRVITRSKRALDEFFIEGVPTLIPFHRAVLENKNFIKGELSTAFIKKEKIFDTLYKKREELDLDSIKKEKVSIDKMNKKDIAFCIARIYFQMKQERTAHPTSKKWRSIIWQDL